jgi:hypothetical protein
VLKSTYQVKLLDILDFYDKIWSIVLTFIAPLIFITYKELKEEQTHAI